MTTVTLTDAETRVTRAALDLLSRVLCGQVEIVEEVLRDYCSLPVPSGPFTLDQLHGLRAALGNAKGHLGLPPNGSCGIFHRDVPPAARLAVQLLHRIDGLDDPTFDALSKGADGEWRGRHGEPWYGRPAPPKP